MPNENDPYRCLLVFSVTLLLSVLLISLLLPGPKVDEWVGEKNVPYLDQNGTLWEICDCYYTVYWRLPPRHGAPRLFQLCSFNGYPGKRAGCLRIYRYKKGGMKQTRPLPNRP